ncbi:alpha/beta hydrolase [Nitrosomonas aestuarii]|uniref:alpha/beta hydrolase n=1 Tax=Nitrosomonas aestuarii TaxID=52441 RepID=UPI000D31981F|nr:alpha/beta hydrolase fold domain-containing protein [Nitrosomonas aestuarii]PTN12791.1 phospholipase/carboxylesterase [Nitrosomonas aestuarii]
MTTPDLLPAVEIETNTDPLYTVLWMHGLGADGNDFVPVANELTIAAKKRIRFVFPHAPVRPVTINNGYAMRAWYDISGARINSSEDETGIRDSQKAVEALIENEMRRGIASENIVLAGFSQGGAMALQTGLRQKNKLAGIMALSCYLPLADALSNEVHQANAAIPIFMAHGIDDSVVPISTAKASKERLQQANYKPEWHEYPMEHSVCMQEINDIDDWLQRILF